MTTTMTTTTTSSSRTAPTAALVAAPAADERLAGVLAMAPLLVGYAPFAFLVGATIAEAGDPAAAWAGTWLIYAGGAHLTAVQLLDQGVGPLVIVATALLINARLLVTSASMAPYWQGESRWFRLLAAATVVDPSAAVTLARFARPATPAQRRHYYLGVAGTLFVGWTTFVAAGAVVGARIPTSIGLEMAVPLCVTALVAPTLRDRPTAVAVAVAAAVALVGTTLPAGVGMVAALLSGITAGALAERTASGATQEATS